MTANAKCPGCRVLGWASFTGERDAAISSILDARYRRYTMSGRAAIALALRAADIGPADKVLVPTYHCPTMVAPVVHAGAQAVFYPITADGAPDLDWIRRAGPGDARALLAVHYFGWPQPMSAIRRFCDERGIHLVEDCAHCFFGATEGRPVGSWGDTSIASLTKFYPVSEGGVLASAARSLDDLPLAPRGWLPEIVALADTIEIGAAQSGFPGLNAGLRGLFGLKRAVRRGRGSSSPSAVPGDEPPAGEREPGGLYAPARAALAARWLAAHAHRARIVDARRRNYAELARRFSGLQGARALRPILPDGVVPYVFPLHVDRPEPAYQRVRDAGIPVFRWDMVWPGTPALAGDQGPVWSRHVFQLGCHQDLSPDQISVIASTVTRIVSE